jgi:hypothetical protein
MEAHVAEEKAASEPDVVDNPTKQSNTGLILVVVLVS